jgi:hypothetical protein
LNFSTLGRLKSFQEWKAHLVSKTLQPKIFCESSGVWKNNTLFRILRYDSLFSTQTKDVGVDKLNTLLLADVCKYKTKDTWFEVMG